MCHYYLDPPVDFMAMDWRGFALVCAAPVLVGGILFHLPRGSKVAAKLPNIRIWSNYVHAEPPNDPTLYTCLLAGINGCRNLSRGVHVCGKEIGGVSFGEDGGLVSVVRLL